MDTFQLESLFVTQPDLDAALTLGTELCTALRRELDADLAMIFTIERMYDGQMYFVPFATNDAKPREHPPAPISAGLLAVSHDIKRPVLVRRITESPTKPLHDEYGSADLGRGHYHQFDKDTDENIVLPLFSANDRRVMCGMVNIERKKRAASAIEWTTPLVDTLSDKMDFFGHALDHALGDQSRRLRVRALVASGSPGLSIGMTNKRQPALPVDTVREDPSKDLLVIAALDEELTEALAAFSAVFPGLQTQTDPENGMRIESASLELGNSQRIRAIFASPMDMGFAAAGIAATRLFDLFRPRLAIMVGIAGGVKGKQQGDVLVAETAGAYRMGRLNEDGSVVIDGIERVERVPNDLRVSLKKFAGNFATAHQPSDPYRQRVTAKVNAHCGPMGSADIVMDSSEVMQSLREIYARKLIGVEMEIYPFYLAASRAPSVPLAFACKAVSDTPGSKGGDNGTDNTAPLRRTDAMYVSGHFAASYVKNNWASVLTMKR